MARKRKSRPTPSAKLTLIESEDRNPMVRVSAGQKVDVVSVSIRDAKTGRKKPMLATLCGYEDDYCVAIIDVD